ncbi:adenylate/guanylate cyclase domain-containing protein [Taibaiella lutea]|nr:adenylate/guanylate cyclase domain-containing protein [Taibaiella lutea]
MKKIPVLLLLLFPLFLKAQQSSEIMQITKDSILQNEVLSIRENWLFSTGDNALWATKEFDDTKWMKGFNSLKIAPKDTSLKTVFNGIGWFRFHFHTDSTLTKMPLALTISHPGASAIYLDGLLIKQYGTFSNKGRHEYIDPDHSPVLILISDTGMHVLAVRYENYDILTSREKYENEYGGFKMNIAKADVAIDAYRSRVLSNTAILLTSGFIFLTLFVVHLVLFLFYRSDKSNLYFSLFNFGIALSIIMRYLIIIAQGVKFANFIGNLTYISTSVACAAISMLVNYLFGGNKIRPKIILLLCFVGMVSPYINYVYADYYYVGLVVICALEAAVLLSVAMYKKKPGSRIIGVGILFFVLFFGIVMSLAAINNGLTTDNPYLGGLLIGLSILAIFSVPLSMSSYLAWSFATVNKVLGEKLVQVEQLSKEAMEHQQEKQHLLESRKGELEKEVALRTTEVIYQKEQIEVQHEALKSEKKKSDELLLNILPAEVAEELKEKGQSKAQLFDDVSVLFTDFVNFTQMSEQLGAEELVAELHECFKAFDNIMEHNGLEKIKTIGDAYLAVSGIPVYNDRHAYNAIKAALEIITFMKERSRHTNTFEIRIGIHSGPLVAGIVGVKKFAYDIWGDTVNTASRMESTSEAGKINISEATYKLAINDFIFTYRGKIDAKHKGEIDMYFVDNIINK